MKNINISDIWLDDFDLDVYDQYGNKVELWVMPNNTNQDDTEQVNLKDRY
ncbi:protein of unknown function [Xenorhabdus poinarii G6]|uniref:Uncharacterized protein n=1 Tax=Xenorhabdus poinarii G6 TaxID=1354304 RepID=A0A068QXR3_9GAMM|nr:protein of unknown function [Xenorhabdus poinarii G6]